MKPHAHTTALADLIEHRTSRLPAHEAARFLWLAWIHFSSRSWIDGADFSGLTFDAAAPLARTHR